MTLNSVYTKNRTPSYLLLLLKSLLREYLTPSYLPILIVAVQLFEFKDQYILRLILH